MAISSVNPITQVQTNQTSTDNSSKVSYSDNSSTRTLIDNKVDNSSKWSYSDNSSFNYDSSVKQTYTDNTNNSVNTSYTDNSKVDNSVTNTYTDNSDHSDHSDNSTKIYSFENISGPVFFQSSISGGVGNTSISGGVGTTYIDNSVNNIDNSITDNSVNNIDNSVTTITDNRVTDNSTNVISQGNAFVYSGGDKVIDNYKVGDKIKLAADYQGIGLEGNSFFVKSSTGQLEIQDSRDKFVEYTSEDEETVAYTYVASGEGEIDGRGKSEAEIMIGGDDSNNSIIGGEGASSLWGGNGGDDVLIGGEGYTEFFYAAGSGNDVVQNSTSNDMVNLLGISIEQITTVDVSLGEVNINFMDGGSLKVEGNTGVGYKLGDQVYTVNQSTGEWSTK